MSEIGVAEIPPQNKIENPLDQAPFTSVQQSEKHPYKDRENEDRAFVINKHGIVLAGVLDGMTGDGTGQGAVAAAWAESRIKDIIDPEPDEDTGEVIPELTAESGIERTKEVLRETLEVISKQIETRANTATSQSGTTVALAAIIPEGDKWRPVIAKAGNSRVYLNRGGQMICLTLDDIDWDSVALKMPQGENQTQKEKIIKARRKLQKTMSTARKYSDIAQDSKAKNLFYHKNFLSNYLGCANTKIDIVTTLPDGNELFFEEGDQLWFFTDGVTDPTDDTTLQHLLSQHPGPEGLSEGLNSVITYSRETASKNTGVDQHFRATSRTGGDDMTGVGLARKISS